MPGTSAAIADPDRLSALYATGLLDSLRRRFTTGSPAPPPRIGRAARSAVV